MGGLFGKNTVIDNGSVASFQVNQATYDKVTPVILGTSRQATNVIDYFDFTKIQHRETQGGKGGPSTTTVTYTYKAAVLLALCEGQIKGIGKVWVGTDTITTLADAGFTLFDGKIGQAPWAYTVSKYPGRALPYSGLAYVAGYIDLDSNAGLKQYNLEIQGLLLDTGDGVDINPADGCKYILLNTANGTAFTDANIHNASYANFQKFCKAADLFVTVPLTDQAKAYETINKLCEITNTITFWSQRKEKFVPRCESEITGNGVTYTPNLTPEYDLTDEDFLEVEDGKLVTWERTDNAETYNYVTVEFTNRDNGYETETVNFPIQADIKKRGLRSMSTLSYHEIHTKARAEYVAQQKAMDSCYGRNTYKFKLGITHCRFEPGGIVTLTNEAAGLNKLPVSIESKKESGNWEYEFEAKYKPLGTYNPARYTTHNADRPSLNKTIDPGNVNTPLFFETPFADGSHNVGIAACGGDNWGGAYVWISADDEAYQQFGEITAPSRYGKTTTALTAAGTSVTVEMADSDAQLLSTSATSADANAMLICIGTEWMAYETATLINKGIYTLSGLRRGVYGTVADHAINEDFLRYDRDGFLYPYLLDDVGRTIYIKLTSYNLFGLALQSLDDVTGYQYTIRGAGIMTRIERGTRQIAVAGWTSFTFDKAFNNPPALSVGQKTVGTIPYYRNVTATGFEALVQKDGANSIGEFTYEAQGW